jgi:cell division protein ZapA
MKQIEVQILGQGYLLGCPEGGESRLLEAVERVDTAMCRIRDAGKIRARDRIAVLAALNLAFDLADRSMAELQARRDQPAPMPPCRNDGRHQRRCAADLLTATPGPLPGRRRPVALTPATALGDAAPLGLQWTRLRCMPGFIFP